MPEGLRLTSIRTTGVLLRLKLISVMALLATLGTFFLAAPAEAADSFDYTCFGYTGNFKGGSHISRPDWTGDGKVDECFGVAPNRKIYHAWSGHSWVEMPNNGRADDMVGYYLDRFEGIRDIIVKISSGDQYRSQYIITSGQSWQGWDHCTNECSRTYPPM